MWKFLLVVGLVWVALAAAFAVERAGCVPILSPACLAAGRTKLGDLVLLTWVDNWATFAAGLLVLLAGLMAAWYLKKQIDQRYTHEQARRAKQMVAVRAVLPLALDECVTYAMTTGKVLRRIRGECVDQSLPKSKRNTAFPAIPYDVVDTLKQAIEFSGNEREEQAYAKIIADLQMQRARLKNLQVGLGRPTNVVTSLELDTYLLQTAEIHARAEAMFDYARNGAGPPPADIDAGRLYTALYFIGCDKGDLPELFDTAERRYGAATRH